MDATVAVPIGWLAFLGLKLMPPSIHFCSPVQRSKSESESFWHVPIRVFPKLFGWVGPRTITGCDVYLDLYRGGACTEKIRLGWGDAPFGAFSPRENVSGGYVWLVPVAWRSEIGDDRKGYFTDTRFIVDRQSSNRFHPIVNNRSKHLFKLRMKNGAFMKESPHFYQVRCPASVSNGHFTVEIVYEGEGTQG